MAVQMQRSADSRRCHGVAMAVRCGGCDHLAHRVADLDRIHRADPVEICRSITSRGPQLE
ncbi:hypothetical protein [Brachybacterium sp. GU-2]|uniref:hypothetical protein n=1 Tax=Brachybacterium sp. GU-2 TaxID=3069708 RepID=UPI00280BCAC5|nr:hypothetical protein [Brachybacterium sp. GU-2]WME21649.1 hypothetical protein RBL05_08750 [Brachybacterium sp. GU-2]